MFIVDNIGLAIVFCVITMLGWGSWANTLKLAGKDKWQFPLYYWDYAIGVFALSIVMMATLGVAGTAGMSSFANLSQAAGGPLLRAFLSGVLFNVSNILLVVAIDAAGMSVAFPVGVGLALVIGTVASYLQSPKGNGWLLFAGVVLVVCSMCLSAVAHSKLPPSGKSSWARGVVFAVIAGCLMGFFYPELSKSISPDFGGGTIRAGYLTPYTALFSFCRGPACQQRGGQHDVYAGGGAYLYGLSAGHAQTALAGISWRHDLDVGFDAERHRLRCGGPRDFVCTRPGRNARRCHLGRLHLA
jgi:glucose uptake protein